MRRGHPGSGGWRSDNPRPFRSRNGGTPHYRTPRNYTVLENTRCTPSIPRPHRGPDPYPRLTRHLNEISPENHLNRNKFREMNNPHNIPWLQNRSHSQTRNILPLFSLNVRQQNINSFGNFSHLYNNNQQERVHVNSLGDIDLRQQSHIPHNQASYGRNQHISPWSVPPPGYENKKSYNHQDKSTQKQYLPSDPEGNKPPVLEYGGHRPPSSDHYGGNPQTMVSNNNSFSRSVDDTVDIVRKRLMSRNESQHSSDDTTLDEPSNDQDMRENMSQHIQEEPPIKKRIQRQKQNVKANCDKMKSNIVHQLFKMDKDKMHKLMDNPSSSTKFEYAISSLITESQNSLHQHLRSVAEKSLYSSSKDFIHNDNNTIYEDTFMKQMQCLLDPQDTVLLEDIKPIVMAELSKVLQLDDLEQRYDRMNDLSTHYSVENQSPYFYGCHNYEESHPGGFCQENQIDTIKHENSEKMDATEKINYKYNEKAEYVESQVLYERRPKQKESNLSMDSQKQEMPINIAEVKFENSEKFVPQFDANADLLSDEEDPFAEFDRQYHVAVDPNFIENDDNPCIQEITAKIETDDLTSVNKEIDGHIQNIAKSQLELFPENNKDNSIHQNKSSEYIQTLDSAKKDSANLINSKDKEFELEQPSNEQEHVQPKEVDKVIVKSENATNLSKSSPISTQKRSTNQRPSHRKEKRKKSECSQPDITKYDSDKDKCCSTAKSIINLIFPRDDSYKEILKDNKKTGGTDKMYSDKYVKRKETSKKIKDTVSQSGKKRTSSTSSHSNSSPKDNNNTSQSATKSDPKTKLKTIDMFMKQPKKPTLHQSHRNTAPNSTTTPKLVDGHTTVSKHMGTQVYKKLQPKATQTFESKCMNTRYSQTEQVKCASKLVQTDPVISEKVTSRSNDAFERMKEIDMEIQVLLQEKFKLYSSLESKESCKSSMPTLGMTVLNVTAYDETKEDEEVCDDIIFSADSIVDDFSNIPAEELEQIALNSVQDDIDVTHTVKGSVVQKLQQEKIKSEIPSTRRAKKSKTPNISLLEQIITDDRPLEDIISLDDLEKPPVKSKRKPYKSQPKKKSKRTAKTRKHLNINSYKLKECSVLLMKADISNYLNRDAEKPTAIKTEVSDFNSEPPLVFQVPEQLKEGQIGHHDIEPHEIVGEALNELQFDMLDVSEDIVIGDNCEIKYSEDKDHYRIPISEDIILDNSQSSCDDKVIESGQVESVCKTYDYSTDESLRRDAVIVTGHADAVLAIECIENDFIAACLDGNVYHFSNDGQLLNTLRGSNLAVTCLTIVKEKYETIVYTGSLDSRIRYYDLETGLEKGPECNVLSPIQTMDRAWDTIFVGTRTGFVLQFECKNNMLIPVSTVKFSEQSILALRALKEGPRKVLLVAARSENVTIKDAQTGLLLRTLMGPKMTVYTLLFEDGKVYCGTSNHQIHVFDYSSGTHTACHEGGKGAVCLRATGGLLFAGCYDGCIYVYREGEPRPLAQLRGPSLMLLSLAIVGSKIIAGYKDRSLYIWKIPLSVLKEMIL